ncbi:MAG TPA: class I SAM-dependent methyltransferase [Chitinophagales bacterium]|jgi:23S rRNA (cytosine1962-C5)-methyltransferase|nr:class I SAM-dependent methyltransferase [Chitinophagales bacterium]HQW78328.1 class I SAM-dependent methyltransferase [Chitinophagales bacterium]HRB20037.1 class I SAM-dependent methyltransferase [Chitinophagales bacterium]HRB67767.1 class I SAM-dependent methyltransferase [Chitinophagales bacterium]HRB69957.1 class I SAM-dependent methyltransferase [Chitinophagales bacterium]
MQEKFTAFENRLKKVYKHLSKIARKQQVSCYRLYQVDLPEFPFIIDVYKDCVYVAEYKSKHKLSEEEYKRWLTISMEIIESVLDVNTENVFLKLRERQKGEQQYHKLNKAKTELIVQENGMSFIVNLSDYLDTGLFLDHRITRQKIKEIATEKRVLNLFSYTGSFTVYAAAGNAAKITTVDMSKTYITWAKRNLSYNKLYDEKKHIFVQEDVLQYLKTIAPNSYDVIILDPPTFSNSKRMENTLDIQRDHVGIINVCLSILSENGVLIFSTNYRNFVLDTVQILSSNIKEITKQTTPFDFEGKLKRACFWIEK